MIEQLQPDEDEMFEMSDLSPSQTGLCRRIWVSVNVRQRHRVPHLKVEGSGDLFYPVTLREPVEFMCGPPPGWPEKELEDLRQFISLSRTVLLNHWRDEIDTWDCFIRMRRVKGAR
jgi:hypothetical protein